ncbi:MAG TPA: phage exclusion protein Lit family protein [Hyphomicrobiaceae bacterium]|nr:phage exclusion protein Lit family protein [Hyphomicrobiaceae bacterium]
MAIGELHLQVPAAAAPERAPELRRIIAATRAQVEVASDKPGFQLETAFGLIVVGRRVPSAAWIIARAAWECLGAYSPAALHGTLSASQIAALPGQQAAADKVSCCLDHAHELLHATDVKTFDWPACVPLPEDQAATPVDEVARDITMIAWAFVLLHELKHVQLASGHQQPLSRLDEERACDAFAISFLLDDVDRYATTAGKPLQLARDLRAMGAITGLFLVALIGQDAGDSHAPARERFSMLFDKVGVQPVQWFWLYAAVLLMGTLQARRKDFHLDSLRLDRSGLETLLNQL